jgi:hypothetical protein
MSDALREALAYTSKLEREVGVLSFLMVLMVLLGYLPSKHSAR